MKGVYSDIEQLQETDIPSFAYQIASGMVSLYHTQCMCVHVHVCVCVVLGFICV